MSGETGLRCVCGGRVYDRDTLIALARGTEEEDGWYGMWMSLLGPFDLYCSNEDEVLTEEEVWRVRGLKVPVHDEHDPADDFPDDMELVA